MKKIRSNYLLPKSVFIVTVLFTYISCVANTAHAQLMSSESVTALLRESEKIGTQNPKQYNDNLNTLKQSENFFSPYQKDYFDYLTYYRQGYNGDFADSLKNFTNLFERSTYQDIKFRAKSKIANIHIISGNIPQAINALDYVLNHIDIVKQQHLKHEAYKIASTIYFLLDENEISENFSNLMLKSQPTQSDYCKATTNIARIKLKTHKRINNDDKLYVQDSIKACEEIGDYVFSNLLKVQWLKHQLYSSSDIENYQSVLQQLKNAEEQIDNTRYKNLINIKNAVFTQTYWKLGNFDKTLEYAEKTLKQSESIGGTLQRIEVLEILTKYYKNISNDKLAFYYLSLKNQAEKKYYDQEQAKIMAYQTAKHNSLAKSHEIELLSQKNQLLSLEKNLSQKIAINQKLVIVFLVIITGFILLWGFKNKKNQKRYKQLSETDDLTGIYNRKGLKDFMELLLAKSSKNKQSVAYAIFDLDNFKDINDQFGHIVGDWVIKKVIETCQLVGNNKVTLGRVGGEEFAMAMGDADSLVLSEHAEKCRKKLLTINTEETGAQFTISASFGITSSTHCGYDYDTLMNKADQAMYTAKIAGRNMVVNHCDNQ